MPRSFLITNQRYGKNSAGVVDDVAFSITLDRQGDTCEDDFEAKTDDDSCYKRSSGSTGSSDLDFSCESYDYSYTKDIVSDTPVVDSTGRSCYTVFGGLPMIRPTGPVAFCDESSYDAIVLPPPDQKFHFSLFPELLNYISSTARRMPEACDVMTKDAYYKLDDNLNELVERTWEDEATTATNESADLHVCPDCGKQYSTSSNLARHRQTHRSVAGVGGDRKSRKCPHCDKEYVSMPAYSMHVRTHNQGCACPHCGKRFSRPWLLQGHVRTHTGEKPFRCPQCAKTFADKSNLRAHVQTHSTEKPFVCGRCGKAFALKSYLYKHEESSCMRTSRLYDGPHQRNQL